MKEIREKEEEGKFPILLFLNLPLFPLGGPKKYFRERQIETLREEAREGRCIISIEAAERGRRKEETVSKIGTQGKEEEERGPWLPFCRRRESPLAFA